MSRNEHNWCVWFKSVMGWEGEGGRVQLSGNESSIYLSLSLSPLSGGARGPALGYSHYLGDVGLGSGLVSHWQHSLHCHHGKRLQRDALISHFSISAGEKTAHRKTQLKQITFVHGVVKNESHICTVAKKVKETCCWHQVQHEQISAKMSSESQLYYLFWCL